MMSIQDHSHHPFSFAYLLYYINNKMENRDRGYNAASMQETVDGALRGLLRYRYPTALALSGLWLVIVTGKLAYT